MKSNSVVFITNNKDVHLPLINIIEPDYDLKICSYNAESWTDIDFYSNKNIFIILDRIPGEKEALWILSKLYEDGVFSDVPVLFTSYEVMCNFENLGFSSFACDFLPEKFDVIIAQRRISNLCEIRQLKLQIINLTQIHTKRILNQANKLKEQHIKMQTMNYELVELLVAAIESRDLESGQHIKRIKYFTKALTNVVMERCPEYKITKEEAEYIFYASSVHDIGKIAIPDAIMLKPGRLTPEEFEIMKTHTTKGYELLGMLDGISNDNPYFKYCQEICYSHHERWDGKGYPRGLKGDETPISAQIVSVCDCYDALRSERPYKSALSHEESVDLILSGGCGCFSPQLLNCFIEALPEFERISNEFKNDSNDNENKIVFKNEPLKPTESDIQNFNDCEERILSSFDIVFKNDVINDIFTVVRGAWDWFFPYVPKNFNEAVLQCVKVCHPADAPRFAEKVNLENFRELVKQGKRKTRIEFRIVKDNVEYLAVGFIVFGVDDGGELISVNGVFNTFIEGDIIDDVKYGLGVTDSLTGLSLQKQFQIDVNSYIKSNPNSKNLLIYIDIDKMSFCNNMFGYDFGNALIKDFANKLRNFNGSDKIVCKGPSDKFIMFVKNIQSQGEVVVFVEKLHQLLRKPYHTVKESGEFTATMGVSRYPNDGKDFKSLSIAAEYAARTAKMNKTSTYAFFNASMKNFASYTLDEEYGRSQSEKSDYEPKFIPVTNASTGELVCYDYIPYSSFDNEVAVTTETYYELNKSIEDSKNLSILSIKTLLFMMIGLRNNGKVIPPLSVYTMLTADDMPSFLQELKTFTSENDCSGIELCLLFPQDIVDTMSQRGIKDLSEYFHSLGYKFGLFLVGTRYVHNNCFMTDVYDRMVVNSDLIDKSIDISGGNEYLLSVLSTLRRYTNVVTIPSKLDEYQKDIIFSADFRDFSCTDKSISGTTLMMEDFSKRTTLKPQEEKNKEKVVLEKINPSCIYSDVLKSELVWVYYDLSKKSISVTPNINRVFGFDITSIFKEASLDELIKHVHPDDIKAVLEAISEVRLNLNIAVVDARFTPDIIKKDYFKVRGTLICAIDEDTANPVRFQCAIARLD